MPLHADLYLDRIDFCRHADMEICRICQVDSLEELLDRLRSGQITGGRCPHWPRERVAAFRLALGAGQSLPVIPSLDIPRPIEPGVHDLNGATAEVPALITGNSEFTQEVLLAVLSTTTAPMRLVAVDTGGHTLDMSLVFETFTPAAISHALRGGNFAGRIILPGLAEELAAPVSEILHRPVEVGPVCAAELPLFFGADWV
jgi:hypothetical protein